MGTGVAIGAGLVLGFIAGVAAMSFSRTKVWRTKSAPLATVTIVDTAAGTRADGPALRSARMRHGVFPLAEGRALVLEGLGVPRDAVPLPELFDPKAGEWRTVSRRPAITLGNDFLALPDGGALFTAQDDNSDHVLLRWSFADDRWTAWPVLPSTAPSGRRQEREAAFCYDASVDNFIMPEFHWDGPAVYARCAGHVAVSLDGRTWRRDDAALIPRTAKPLVRTEWSQRSVSPAGVEGAAHARLSDGREIWCGGERRTTAPDLEGWISLVFVSLMILGVPGFAFSRWGALAPYAWPFWAAYLVTTAFVGMTGAILRDLPRV